MGDSNIQQAVKKTVKWAIRQTEREKYIHTYTHINRNAFLTFIIVRYASTIFECNDRYTIWVTNSPTFLPLYRRHAD
jgi:hypothetical protein